MKTIHTVISQVTSMINHNTYVIIMIVFGMIVCNIMFTYTYGFVEQFKKIDMQPDMNISYVSGKKLSADEIYKKISSSTSSIDFYSIIDSKASTYDESVNLNDYLIRSRRDSSYFYTIVGSSGSLSQKNTILVPNEYSQYKIHDTITLNDHQYTIVGVVSMPYFVVSFNTYLENIIYPDVISLKIKNENKSIAESTIRNLFDGYSINLLSESGQVTEQIYKMYVSTLAVYAVSMLALLCLMTYIFEQYSYELSIYALAGASQRKIKIIIFLTMMTFIVFADAAALILHTLLYNSLFSQINLINDYRYYTKDYCKIYLSSLIVTVLYIVIMINVKFRKDTLTNMRRSIM